MIVIIGNEVLSGKTADKNAVFLTRELRALGVAVEGVVIIPDDVERIAEEIRNGRKRVDLIFTSGGIGPTPDDVTMAGVALGVGKPLIQHPVLIELIAQANQPGYRVAQARLAEVPDGTELIFAEGLRFPVLHYENIFIFPGIPDLLVKKFSAVKERFRGRPFHLTKIFLSEREYAIADRLREVLRQYPDLLLGSYPKWRQPDHRIVLTLESKDKDYMDRAKACLIAMLPKDVIVKIEEDPVLD